VCTMQGNAKGWGFGIGFQPSALRVAMVWHRFLTRNRVGCVLGQFTRCLTNEQKFPYILDVARAGVWGM